MSDLHAELLRIAERGSCVEHYAERMAALPEITERDVRAEFGTGGYSWDYADGMHGMVSFDGRGLRLTPFREVTPGHGVAPAVTVSWAKVAEAVREVFGASMRLFR